MAAGLGSLGLGHGDATFMPTRTQSLSSPDQLDWCLLRKGNCGGQTRADPRRPTRSVSAFARRSSESPGAPRSALVLGDARFGRVDRARG